MWSTLGKPVDFQKWEMTVPTVSSPHCTLNCAQFTPTEFSNTWNQVNAYYNPPLNEIVFPAGIMQQVNVNGVPLHLPSIHDFSSSQSVSAGCQGYVSEAQANLVLVQESVTHSKSVRKVAGLAKVLANHTFIKLSGCITAFHTSTRFSSWKRPRTPTLPGKLLGQTLIAFNFYIWSLKANTLDPTIELRAKSFHCANLADFIIGFQFLMSTYHSS